MGEVGKKHVRVDAYDKATGPVSYTHLTLPTMAVV